MTVTNIWAHPHPIDANIVSEKDTQFTGVSISIHRAHGGPVSRVVPQGTDDKVVAELLRSMANELEGLC